jgi:hypothetical protein
MLSFAARAGDPVLAPVAVAAANASRMTTAPAATCRSLIESLLEAPAGDGPGWILEVAGVEEGFAAADWYIPLGHVRRLAHLTTHVKHWITTALFSCFLASRMCTKVLTRRLSGRE